MEPIEQIERAGYTAKIFVDYDAESPDSWDTFGSLAYKDRRIAWNSDDLPNDPYEYGMFTNDCPACEGQGRVQPHPELVGDGFLCKKCEGRGYVTDGEAICKRMHDAVAVLPVYAADGPYTMVQEADSWEDANGWIYATQATADMTGVPEEAYLDALRQELDTWNQYFSGDVYGIVIENPAGEEVDSCWGFYGLDDTIEEAKGMLDIEEVRLIESHPNLANVVIN